MKEIFNVLLRLWLLVWVITLPLIHIHPEADHAHETGGQILGGTYHSILINTAAHSHQDHVHNFFKAEGPFDPVHSQSHSTHDLEDSTYSFSVIKPSIDRETEKSEFPNDGFATTKIESPGVPDVTRPHYSSSEKLFSILPKTLSPRAPPIHRI